MKTKQILLLDDSAAIHKVMMLIFKRDKGYDVVAVQTEQELWTKAQSFTPALIIVYLHFTKEQNLEIFEKLKKICPNILIMHDKKDDLSALQNHKFENFLCKPFLSTDLKQKVDLLLFSSAIKNEPNVQTKKIEESNSSSSEGIVNAEIIEPVASKTETPISSSDNSNSFLSQKDDIMKNVIELAKNTPSLIHEPSQLRQEIQESHLEAESLSQTANSVPLTSTNTTINSVNLNEKHSSFQNQTHFKTSPPPIEHDYKNSFVKQASLNDEVLFEKISAHCEKIVGKILVSQANALKSEVLKNVQNMLSESEKEFQDKLNRLEEHIQNYVHLHQEKVLESLQYQKDQRDSRETQKPPDHLVFSEMNELKAMVIRDKEVTQKSLKELKDLIDEQKSMQNSQPRFSRDELQTLLENEKTELHSLSQKFKQQLDSLSSETEHVVTRWLVKQTPTLTETVIRGELERLLQNEISGK